MSESWIFYIKIPFLIIDFGLFWFSVIGNTVVIYVILRDKKQNTKSNYHILSLATIDLLVGLGIPLAVMAVRNSFVQHMESKEVQEYFLSSVLPELRMTLTYACCLFHLNSPLLRCQCFHY